MSWLSVWAKAESIGAVVSVLGAVGSTALLWWNNKSLERTKSTYQRELEALKARLQGGLETRKTELQGSLEVRKSELQGNLEVRKSELQTELEGRKFGLQKDLEQFKAGIADEAATQNARRGYEFEARKRLYAQVEPLLFQLFEAAETAFHAVTSLARRQRDRELPESLSIDDYYIRSIIHRLFVPLAIFRLIQRSTTLIDLSLDPTIRLRHAILKECYLTWTDDFGLAKLAPEVQYRPNETNWRERRASEPAVYWRQGLVIGRLDRLIDAMVVKDSNPQRPMNFGEFETAVKENRAFHPAYEPAQDVFLSFDFRNRPVLGRILLTYACLMHTLMSVYGKDVDDLNLTQELANLVASQETGNMLRWWDDTDEDMLAIVRPYVLDRIKQATTVGSYVKF